MTRTAAPALLDRLPAHPIAAYQGEPHTLNWHAIRRSGLGGSDVAAALGLDRFRTPWEVYTSKVSGVEDDAGEPAQWGTRLEPIVAEWAAGELGAELYPWPAILRSAERPWMLGSIDRLVESDALRVLECKVTRWDEDWKDDDLPQRVEAQARWYLSITGLEECVVAALLHGTRGELRRVRRDETIERLLVDEAERFWDRVSRRDAPEPGPSERVTRILNRTPAAEGVSRDLSEEWRLRLDERRFLKAELADLQDDLDSIDNALRADLGEATRGFLDGDEVVTYKPQVSRRVDLKALDAEIPEVAEHYRRETTTRVLRVREAS